MYAQDLSFKEPQALFAGARTVIAPHGAGPADLVWAQRAERVIEIFPDSWFNDCYARLSRNLGIDYGYVVASPGTPGSARRACEREYGRRVLSRLNDRVQECGAGVNSAAPAHQHISQANLRHMP
ncbi:hypothetical protein GCM10010271_37740 [Streptomyces kurssanovii]|nr:hypothetical protein GCM10010271_37740 [Streptomyces kurssanovii]